MKFNYQTRTKQGEIRSGTVEASSREAALDLLQKYGFYVTFLEEIKPRALLFKDIKLFKGVSKKNIVVFSRQLAIMFEAKVPPADALRTLGIQTENPILKETIFKITEEVKGGMPLSRAFGLYPKFFSTFYVAMIESGEASGELSKVLNYLAEHLEREYHLQSQIKGAMIYPIFVLFVFSAVFFVMTFFIMPRLRNIFVDMGEELPMITKIMLGISDFFKSWGLLLILTFLALFFLAFRYAKTKKGKEFFDEAFLRTPGLNNFLRKIYLSQFAENLSTLISAGVPISRALEITGNIIGNSVYKKIIIRIKSRVVQGESISSVLTEFPEYISPLFSQMTAVGERTGRLDTSLMNIVSFYQKEVDVAVNNLASIIEPLLVVLLGVMVGALVISVFVPIYQIIGRGGVQ